MRENSYQAERQKVEEIERDTRRLQAVIKTKKTQLDAANTELKDASIQFFSTYGFDYLKSDEEVVEEELYRLNLRNQEIKTAIKDLLIAYVNYYDGQYYEKEDYSSLQADFEQLAATEGLEPLPTDLYTKLNVNDFVEGAKTDGTIGYLDSINSDSKFNNLLLFLTCMYSNTLYEISHDLSDVPDNLNGLYNDLYSTREVYRAMENFNFNVGILNPDNLDTLLVQIRPLIVEFNNNRGVMDQLSGGGMNANQ
ncbi:hypothetical protein O6R05_03675 [Peptoniphilus equinus]|uniref:Uncharacterized protein n=1 Tax=Peptoniphilus equinus TaxID=3016343 RepID=A0ABY7QV41_9FIRM|nr:hypothetical protein [Peptoniphilus equinus]WBW50659.1 hypothetical protein O6R05_03675 [Peptoniphilus equinus]